jgi:hypothetical protein
MGGTTSLEKNESQYSQGFTLTFLTVVKMLVNVNNKYYHLYLEKLWPCKNAPVI